jgi:hypothetical protein
MLLVSFLLRKKKLDSPSSCDSDKTTNYSFQIHQMKAIFLFTVLLLSLNLYGQDVIKDLDKDGKQDTVTYDPSEGVIICKLSSKNFKPVYSKTGLSDEINSGVQATKSGFEFFVNHMRAGGKSQFRYEPKEKKIRLIGMSRYEFGPANNNGSGESSVNLLTNKYIGLWNYYDENKEKLIAMPAIKVNMLFPKIYLENYDGSSDGEFMEKCSALYYEQKNKMQG